MLRYAAHLSKQGVPIIAIPKTIHNNIFGTDYTIGFSTGLARGVAFIHELRSLAGSREQAVVIETFRVNSGLSTLMAGFLSGADRVIIGTEAIRNPGLVDAACKTFMDSIVVGIDARKGMVAIEGWTEDTRTQAVDLARRFEDSGVVAINFTDIHRDGMQTGPNIEETRKMAESVSVPVIASGGVSTLTDIRNLLPLEPVGVSGVITGKALYSGSLDLKAAIALTKSS